MVMRVAEREIYRRLRIVIDEDYKPVSDEQLDETIVDSLEATVIYINSGDGHDPRGDGTALIDTVEVSRG
jgi:hypothetical protein